MGDLINLRQLRKARLRDERSKSAAANRQAFGQSKAERQVAGAAQECAKRVLDGAKRVHEASDDHGAA